MQVRRLLHCNNIFVCIAIALWILSVKFLPSFSCAAFQRPRGVIQRDRWMDWYITNRCRLRHSAVPDCVVSVSSTGWTVVAARCSLTVATALGLFTCWLRELDWVLTAAGRLSDRKLPTEPARQPAHITGSIRQRTSVTHTNDVYLICILQPTYIYRINKRIHSTTEYTDPLFALWPSFLSVGYSSPALVVELCICFAYSYS